MDIYETYTKTGLVRYNAEIRHAGLGQYRHIKGDNYHVVSQKARVQLAKWDEQWTRKREIEERRATQHACKDLAIEKTEEAQQAIAEVLTLLDASLLVDDTINWEAMKDKRTFPVSSPKQPTIINPRPKPEPSNPEFDPKYNLFDVFVSSWRERKSVEAKRKYNAALEEWNHHEMDVNTCNENNRLAYEREHSNWLELKQKFVDKQAIFNSTIDEKRDIYLSGDPEAILDYCDLVLSNSEYPDSFPKNWDMDYDRDTKVLIVEYSLPSPNAMPTLKEVKYIQSRDSFEEKHISKAEENRNYDSVIYQIALRTIHELFEGDVVRGIDSIVFNGWVHSVDPGTGKDTNAVILSLHTTRDEFCEVKLSRVEPKTCFKTLKGVGSSKLHSLTPVAPIMKMDRDDSRFIQAREVVDRLAEGLNVAAMDWDEFEHLVREIFEAEFACTGGEVKVTQASRDRGIDAVIFDPDPIRGGKIVVQAKRYTNTVGVDAVRDLYGTLINEGALKGILITTSDYGPDAYSFAKDKPLTLLSGSNLLHLLEKHGKKARIDIVEAKRILSQKEN